MGKHITNTLNTTRLIGQPLCQDHYDFIHQMHQNEKVMHHLGGLRSTQQTDTYFEHNLSHWDQYGYGIWVLKEKSTGNYIGRSGLRQATFNGTDEHEIAYGFMPDYWRQGFATEITRELIRIAFDILKLNSLTSITVPENIGSCQVLTKCGFTQDGEVLHQNRLYLLYRLINTNS